MIDVVEGHVNTVGNDGHVRYHTMRYPYRWWLSCLLALVLVAPASAQFHRHRFPVINPFYNPYFGPGGVMRGWADVLSANGELVVQQERARLERELAEQARLETRRQLFDLQRYERENTPSFTERQRETRGRIVDRMLHDPTIFEVTNGRALNVILPYLHGLTIQGLQGSDVPLSPSVLDRINVSVPGRNDSAGLLMDGGNMRWPFALRGEVQQNIDKMLPEAVRQARSDNLDPALFRQIRAEARRLDDVIRNGLRNNELDGASTLEAQRFVRSFNSALNVLQSAEASKILGGFYAARGRNVYELVVNMTRDGLQFAPASPGGESAYVSLHLSMRAFAAGADYQPGFRVLTSPLP